jgi:hypothetical protein
MHEALCRSSGTTLDSVHAEDGPPITQRTSGLCLFQQHVRLMIAERCTSSMRNVIRQNTRGRVRLKALVRDNTDRFLPAFRFTSTVESTHDINGF